MASVPTTYAESVLPPGPWRVVGNKILAGDTAVAVIVSRNAHAVAMQITEIVNQSEGVSGVIRALTAKIDRLEGEVASLQDRDCTCTCTCGNC